MVAGTSWSHVKGEAATGAAPAGGGAKPGGAAPAPEPSMGGGAPGETAGDAAAGGIGGAAACRADGAACAGDGTTGCTAGGAAWNADGSGCGGVTAWVSVPALGAVDASFLEHPTARAQTKATSTVRMLILQDCRVMVFCQSNRRARALVAEMPRKTPPGRVARRPNGALGLRTEPMGSGKALQFHPSRSTFNFRLSTFDSRLKSGVERARRVRGLSPRSDPPRVESPPHPVGRLLRSPAHHRRRRGRRRADDPRYRDHPRDPPRAPRHLLERRIAGRCRDLRLHRAPRGHDRHLRRDLDDRWDQLTLLRF